VVVVLRSVETLDVSVQPWREGSRRVEIGSRFSVKMATARGGGNDVVIKCELAVQQRSTDRRIPLNKSREPKDFWIRSQERIRRRSAVWR
jgi:hypothetical protein